MSKKPGLTLEEKEKIKELIALGNTPHAVAREINRDAKTVSKYAEQMAPEIIEKKKELADWFKELAQRMLASISDKDIEKINAYQRTVAAGISTDKMRLLTDQSTDNVAVLVASLKEMQAERWGKGKQ